jgi:flagellar motor switch protein FliN/FliY
VPVLHAEPQRLTAPLSSPAPARGESQAAMELQRILRLNVPVIVKLAERKLSLSEVLRLGTGAIIEFSKRSDEPLELLINNKAVAVGETVKVGENFGLRLTQIGDVKQVIRSMGGQAGM